MDGLRVVRSRIHGYGVVATRSFAQGEVITQIDGILYRADDGGDDRGTLWLEGDLYLDILDQMRWLNHSCDPNIWVDGGIREDGTPWANVIALRKIDASEELTLDYALGAEQAEPCACGAPACRGWIVDEGEAPVVTTRRRRAASARR
jgi:SET domain-containing protein